MGETGQTAGPTLRRLHRTVAGSSAYLDTVLERVRQASVRFGGHGESLVLQTWKQYAEGTPYLGLWVVLQADQVMGHALADIRNWDFQTVAWVTQVVLDEAAPPTMKTHFLHVLDHWVKDVNQHSIALNPNWKPVTRILMLTGRDAKAWEKHAGFQSHLTLMQRDVR